MYIKLGHPDIARRECETVVELGELLNKENDTVAEARRYLRWFRARDLKNGTPLIKDSYG